MLGVCGMLVCVYVYQGSPWEDGLLGYLRVQSGAEDMFCFIGDYVNVFCYMKGVNQISFCSREVPNQLTKSKWLSATQCTLTVHRLK